MAQYYALHPATFKLDGGAMFGIIPKPLWEKQIPADELNRIHLSLRVLCVRTNNRVILIDTGIGDDHDAKFSQRFAIQGPTNPLVQVLQQELFLSPNEVTDVVVTHLHFDHAGGLGEGHFLFPNARLHLHRRHYEYSQAPTARDTGSFLKDHFLPVTEELQKSGRIEWHEGESGVLLKDDDYTMHFRASHGHTPWLMHPYDERFIYMADLVPTSAHVPIPWVMGYDIAPGRTTVDKHEFYEFIRAHNLVMVFEHDIHFWGARLNPTGPIDKIAERFASQGAGAESLPLA